MIKSHTNNIISNLTPALAWVGLLFVSLLFVSCSDDDDEANEWENWQTKNDTYWSDLYTQTQQRIAAGDTTWKIIPSWTLVDQHPSDGSSTINLAPTDYIIVHVEESGRGTASPMYTDSVRIHYLGRMIPSPTYTAGLIFDASYDYTQGYNLATMRPYDGRTGSFIKGFTTALLNMHKGDRWMVYIPYQLAYGTTTPGSTSTTTKTGSYSSTSTSSTIQPCSNLIFDITLVDFFKPGEKIPVVYSKQNEWGGED